ncbi:MAG: transglutaminase-like domain-containing protein [Actinomycetota bacterium]|nr:transglutaminase-like domain-containing protein [Actinomycetota bacterium]
MARAPGDLAVYATPGPLTMLPAEQAEMLRRSGLDPIDLCRAAQRVLVSPADAAGAGLSEQRMAEQHLRPASALLERAWHLDAEAGLLGSRPIDRRVVGTCRHYAVLATAFLRAAGVPARARCGFATYFTSPEKVDHWIVEYWSTEHDRWIGIDPEYVDRPTPGAARTADLAPGEFLTAGAAWMLIRSGRADASDFGVHGTEHWGPAEVRGNVLRDVASLEHKLEMLPWDSWGPMEESYDGTTGDDFDVLVDRLASAAEDPDRRGLRRLFEPLAVPASLLR